MPPYPPFQARPLDADALPDVRGLVEASGVPGIYVGNALEEGEGETVLLWGAEALLGALWFGPRGNLVMLLREELDPERVADAVHGSYWPWRIALGPAGPIDALAGRLTAAPLVHRDQAWYACAPADARPGARAGEVRPCDRRDRERLMVATLELNRVDLNVDPRRVDRRWLRDMVESRIKDGTTRAIGPAGQFASKLDIGSRGPAGTVIEGVFTFPEHRGQGLAATLVATVAAAPGSGTTCLHVAADNRSARAAYERAGMALRGTCRILLLG